MESREYKVSYEGNFSFYYVYVFLAACLQASQCTLKQHNDHKITDSKWELTFTANGSADQHALVHATIDGWVAANAGKATYYDAD